VADLPVPVSVDWLVGSVVDGSHGGGDWSSNNRGVDGMDGVGNWVSHDGGSVVGGGHHWGLVGGGSNNWGLIGGSSNSGLVSRGGLVGGLLGVDSSSLVGDLSHVSVISVGGVGHLLDSAIGKSDSVGSLDIAGTIGSLLGVEVGLGIVISNSVGEGVGGDLIGVLLSLVSRGGLVSRSGSVSWGGVDSVSNWSGVDSVSNHRSGVDSMSNHWSGVDSVSSVVQGSVDKRGVVGDSVVDGGDRVEGEDSSLANWNRLVGSNGRLDLSKTLGVVHLTHRGVSGTECLGLDQTPLLSMCSGDRLVGGLTSSDGVVDKWGMVSPEYGTSRQGA